MTKMLQEIMDDVSGYYLCECGHYAVEHMLDAPEPYQACFKCDCQAFKLKRRDNAHTTNR